MAVVSYDGKISFEGCVIGTYEHNELYDSDFYAVCINLEEGKMEQVEYSTTRYPNNGTAEADLTEDNFRAYLNIISATQVLKELELNKKSASWVDIGKEVTVVKGRKVPIGTKGTVFWRKEVNHDPYGRSWHAEMRIGFKDTEGNVYWTNERNVEVSDPQKYMKSAQKIIKACKQNRCKNYLQMKQIFAW